MKMKLNQILAGVLVLQVALGVLVFWPRGAGAEQQAVFPDLEASAVESIMIEDDAGEVVILARSGDGWVLPGADSYPALETKVNDLLGSVLGIRIGDTVTSSEASQAALQVAEDDFVRRITLVDDVGEEYVLYLGSSPRYAATHFRVEGENDTHLAVDVNVNELNARASDYVDAVYLRAPQEDLQALQIENAQGTMAFSKDEEGTWKFDELGPGDVQDDTGLNSLVSRAAAVNLTEPLGLTEDPAWGLDEPAAVVTYETADGTITLTVGRQDPDDLSYVVKSSDSEYYVRVREYSVQTFVDAGPETFILQPTPTPTADPALLPSPTEEGEDTEADTVETPEVEVSPEATPGGD